MCDYVGLSSLPDSRSDCATRHFVAAEIFSSTGTLRSPSARHSAKELQI